MFYDTDKGETGYAGGAEKSAYGR